MCWNRGGIIAEGPHRISWLQKLSLALDLHVFTTFSPHCSTRVCPLLPLATDYVMLPTPRSWLKLWLLIYILLLLSYRNILYCFRIQYCCNYPYILSITFMCLEMKTWLNACAFFIIIPKDSLKDQPNLDVIFLNLTYFTSNYLCFHQTRWCMIHILKVYLASILLYILLWNLEILSPFIQSRLSQYSTITLLFFISREAWPDELWHFPWHSQCFSEYYVVFFIIWQKCKEITT